MGVSKTKHRSLIFPVLAILLAGINIPYFSVIAFQISLPAFVIFSD